MEREFARWDDIDVHVKGQVITSGGHGFAALSRRRLLQILQQRCRELGVTVHFRAEAPPAGELSRRHDLVVAADGANSGVRKAADAAFRPDVDVRRCRYMWLGTDLVFDAFKFYIEPTPYGVMQVHGYPYDATGSTFIVEMHDSVWRAAGFDRLAPPDLPPGTSDEASIERIRELFAHVLDGHAVHANNSKWISFGTLRCQSWRHGNVILLGDAAHTAHFSIGSGTKLAMEDALALAACLHEQPGPGRGAGRLRGRAQAGRGVHPARRAGQPGVVREPGPVPAPGAGAVRVQHHDPQPPGHPRQPAGARPGVRGPDRRLVRRPREARRHAARATWSRRCSSRCGCAAWS